MTVLTEYNTSEYVSAKDAEQIFEGAFSALDFNTLFRVHRLPIVAKNKQPGKQGRPGHLYKRSHVDALVQHICNFTLPE